MATEFIGAATEAPRALTTTTDHIEVIIIGRQHLRLCCVPCVASIDIRLPRSAQRLADDLAHFGRIHALCEVPR